jgi:catalase
VKVQIMPEAEAQSFHFNPFDLTMVWPYNDYPLIDVGTLELNRNPVNHFAEVEQAAFEPGNLPPGFGVSPDKMLQARLLSYPDARRYRIGINYQGISVNKPRCPVHSYHRDGQTRFDDNGGRSPVYQPNSFAGPADDFSLKEPPLKISGDTTRYDHRRGNDDYTQAGNLFRLMSKPKQQELIENIVGAMHDVPQDIQVRQIAHFTKADPDYGSGVARGLGIDINKLKAA